MKKIIIAIILCVVLSSPCYAYRFMDSWSRADTALQGVFLGLLAVDYFQTRTMAKNDWMLDGKQYSEINPIMGSHPSTGSVDAYFAISAVGHTIIAMALPPNYSFHWFDGEELNIPARRLWQFLWIGVEAGYVGWNYSVGVRIEF